MKLIRFGEPGRERPGVLLKDGSRIDESAIGSDYDEKFFDKNGLKQLETWLKKTAASARRVQPTVLLGSPICRPSNIICIWLNYRDHAAETKAIPSNERVIFLQPTN